MFDDPPKITDRDLEHIKYLLGDTIKRFLRYEKGSNMDDMRGMARMVNEIGYEVSFEVKLTKRN